MNTKKLTLSALLTALAIITPFLVFFKVIIPPFTATLGSHVPMFISMLLGPEVAILVGIGSALGFFLNLGPVVAARASMHIVVGFLGAHLTKKGYSYKKVVLLTATLHGILEALVVIPFIGFDVYNLLVITCIGTILHHFADGFIAHVIIGVLNKSRAYEFKNV